MQADNSEPPETSSVSSIAAPSLPLLSDVTADISFAEAQQAGKTIRRLKRGNPVRKLARDVMNRRPIGEVQPLFESLANTAHPAQEREIAAWTSRLDAAGRRTAGPRCRPVARCAGR